MADRFPFVSAIMPAYNYARFLPEALDSALGQDYPPDRLEVVVVDDGSRDETPEILADYAARHPRRVRVFRQENAGNIIATNRAMREARGELIAMLDADDTWLAHKTRAQAEIFASRPEVTLVHGDMTMTDGAGVVSDRSLFARFELRPGRGRLLPNLMASNQATTSSIMVRASLRSYFDPIPLNEGISYYDWWLAARTAIAGETDFLGEPCATYRIHGANDTGGATGARLVRERRRELAQQRWLLANVHLRHGLTAGELATLCTQLHERALRLIAEARTPFIHLVAVTEAEEQRARELLESGLQSTRAGDGLAAAHDFARAFACNPYSDDAADALETYLRPLAAPSAREDQRPSFLSGARSFCTLAFADELIADPDLLAAYGRCFDGGDDATLVIVARPELVEPLSAVVDQASLGAPDAAELLALASELDERTEAAVSRSVDAVLSEQSHAARFPVPHLGRAQLPGLRRLAQRHWRRW